MNKGEQMYWNCAIMPFGTKTPQVKLQIVNKIKNGGSHGLQAVQIVHLLP